MADDPRAERRVEELLPEERAAGSADPQAQAAEILAESDVRAENPRAQERRASEDTVDPS